MRRWDQRMALAIGIGRGAFFDRHGRPMTPEERKEHRERVAGLFLAARAYANGHDARVAPHERDAALSSYASFIGRHGDQSDRWVMREARRRFREMRWEAAAA